MNRHLFVAAWLSSCNAAIELGLPTVARAVDIEAFEFNDAAGTLLGGRGQLGQCGERVG